uniref:Uncharacterized protein LOC105108745 isoform X2 n=1 Tax=Rhizophora mucronata TaxID=61149 RepID=A0A2P2M6Z5_RHIMU
MSSDPRCLLPEKPWPHYLFLYELMTPTVYGTFQPLCDQQLHLGKHHCQQQLKNQPRYSQKC